MGAACEIPETAVAIEAAAIKMAARNDMGFPSRVCQLPVVKPHAKAKTVQNCSCERAVAHNPNARVFCRLGDRGLIVGRIFSTI